MNPSPPSGLDPWQRRLLAWLIGLVALVGIALIALVARGPDDQASGTTTSTTVAIPIPDDDTAPSTSASTTTPTTTSTTSPTSTTTSTTTTTTMPADPLPQLAPDAIGSVTFGTDADTAVEQLTDELGPPDEDTGWVDQHANYGTCIGDTVRFVRWGSLRIFLTDGASDWAPQGWRHLAAYGHGENVGTPILNLSTRDGLLVGTPVGDLRAIYGPRVTVEDDPLFGPFYSIEFVGAGQIFGELSGTAPDDRVISIAAGFSCGE